ncbi:1-(5-phosphoribosyl)-5-[(5-phosphoribosylamino)methylideneamino] imidazole-4-carboxamide isomerase [Candidatus Hydrogenisulfobacillus filiaventi]|uniref:1-(5-phosphoribosyl)-5-[(5-phosphoribosylamino)methylideneamino] imidazole-4-carboxamide isomerase n=1 Tax=Candidatus Hydrogenisulfobacillus filiaventi TaxID=2707344 RepID=A0A6F8ZFJ4_9FIRM|nr:HisA/HisF-related TIM barrel protein [Bacillota bacterium]CAB1128232.1 1-(5-phosphoribosyl)-5-[(5-phosphoribosylamino)methylideneamino] imidazole-4-carboxamide isomerase [Candidatus Hydrogenisulfobacillus filiaventi]
MAGVSVWPALDLLDGQVVRLYQGRYNAVTPYGPPAPWLERLREAGIGRLHLVDLDGARRGTFTAWETLETAARLGFTVEAGGGFRDATTIARAQAAGARWVAAGTALLTGRELWETVLARGWQDRVAPALDLRGDTVVVGGWLAEAGGWETVWAALTGAGFTRITVTDTGRDGTRRGLDPAFWARFGGDPRVVAGGGIGSAADLDTLARLGIRQAIVGKAWLEGDIPLAVLAGDAETEASSS